MSPTTALFFIFFITAIFLTWFFTHRSTEKERLLLIKKGVDYSELPQKEKFRFSFPWLKLGIVITCVSFGILTGLILSIAGLLESDIIIPVLMFMFGGIGLILAHFIDKPDKQNES